MTISASGVKFKFLDILFKAQNPELLDNTPNKSQKWPKEL